MQGAKLSAIGQEAAWGRRVVGGKGQLVVVVVVLRSLRRCYEEAELVGKWASGRKESPANGVTSRLGARQFSQPNLLRSFAKGITKRLRYLLLTTLSER